MLTIVCIDSIINNSKLIDFIISDVKLNFEKFLCPILRGRQLEQIKWARK